MCRLSSLKPRLSDQSVACLIVAFASLLASAAYWPGLGGPYLFDDTWNLAPIAEWIKSSLPWQRVLLPNRDSILLSRPIAMASFMINAAWLGASPFSFKLGNLIVHVVVGMTSWVALRQLLLLDPALRARASLLAAALTGIWLVHPLHASTVLYSVQRMAQLAAFFSLIGVLIYLAARNNLRSDHVGRAILYLFVLFPVTLVLGLLSKQNAAVMPLLCFVLEFAYFKRTSTERRVLYSFFAFILIFPAALLVVLLLVRPQVLLSGYSDFHFTLGERLLTQPRVLLDYIGMWLIPRGPQMGLYTDDYFISRGLLTPLSTSLSILVLLCMSGLATWLRKTSPSIFAGWFFFLCAHAVESSFLPLELYYEHRNYLPALGLLLMAAGIFARISHEAPAALWYMRRYGWLLVILLAGLLALATLGRSSVWKDENAIIEQALQSHPGSLRAKLDAASLSMRHANWREASDTLSSALDSPDPNHRFIGRTTIAILNCVDGSSLEGSQLLSAMAEAPPMVTAQELFVSDLIQDVSAKQLCRSISDTDWGNALARMLEAASHQPESSLSKSLVRITAAQMYARGGDWEQAQEHALSAWLGRPTLTAGAVLAYAYINNGDTKSALAVIRQLEPKVESYDVPWQRRLGDLKALAGVAD